MVRTGFDPEAYPVWSSGPSTEELPSIYIK